MKNLESIAGISRKIAYSFIFLCTLFTTQLAFGQVAGDPCVLGTDTDCDGVADICDICPRGDDSIDANNDGIADCAQLLDYESYSDEWKCIGNAQKLLICHIPYGNPDNMQTICVDMDGVLEHVLEHGAPIGPCTCMGRGDEGRGEPTGEDPKGSARVAAPAVTSVFPNPASVETNIQSSETPDIINVYNHVGALVQSIVPTDNHTRLDVSSSQFLNGVYMIEIIHNGERTVERLLVTK